MAENHGKAGSEIGHPLERRFANAFEHAAIGMALTALDGRLFKVNRALCQMLGYEAEPLQQMTWKEITHPDDIQEGERFFRRTLTGEIASYQREKRFLRKDGTVIWGITSVSLYRDEAGNPVHFTTQIQDITERKHLEAEIVLRERRMKAFFTNAPAGLVLLDRDLRFVQINETVARVNGLPIEAHLGRTVREVLPGLAPVAEPLLKRVLETGEPVLNVDLTGETPAEPGVTRYWTESFFPIPSQAGGIEGVGAIFVEITDRKQAEVERDRLFNLSLDMLCVADFEGRLLHVNPAWTECLGWSSEELTSVPMIDFILPADHAATRAIRELIYAGSPVRGFQNRYRCKDGSYRWFSWNVQPIPELKRVFAVARDITEQRSAEEVARHREEEEQRLAEERALLTRRLLESQAVASVGSWETDLKTMEVTWTDETYRIFKQDPALFTPTHQAFLELVHPEDRVKVDDAFWASIGKPGSFVIEHRVLMPDREVRTVEERWRVFNDSTGRPVRALGTCQDVTARKTAADKLREREDLLFHAQDIGGLGSWVMDMHAGKLVWSDATCRLFGITQAEFRGTLEHFKSFILTEDLPELNTMEARLSAAQPLVDAEYRIRRPDGSTRWMYERGKVEYDAAGTQTRRLGVVMDVTERKNMEAQFLRAQRLESIGTLAGGIAHDINNVLSPIMVAADMLEMDLKKPENLEVVRIIKSSTKRAADLAKQVLSFSRGARGERLPVDVEAVVEDLNKLAKDTFPKNITIETAAAPGLWRVKAEPTQLHQVLLNLYVNARDAMPGGGNLWVGLRNQSLDAAMASLTPDARPGDYVVIEVDDTGEGMSVEVMARIFDPFFTTKEVGKGTGLGLSTTLGIVKGYGGFINVYSEPGHGAHFKLYLPAVTGAQEDAALVVDAPSGQFERGDGELILLIDDEENVRSVMRATLERFGYKVQPVSNGAEAVSLYARAPASFAVVLTDMSMPVMDGPATIEALKAINPQVVVVGSSGLDTKGLLARAALAGAKHFISKPYRAEDLLKTMAAAVADYRAAGVSSPR
jgi:PAS domain S-box-containing protein